jgi:hypothetical protein
LHDCFRLDIHIYHCVKQYEREDLSGQQNTYVQIQSMTFWHGALLMNLLALLMMAISIAFPTRSSRSSRSSLAWAITLSPAPEYTGQLVVIAKVKSSILLPYSVKTRVAKISQTIARDREIGRVLTPWSRMKWTRLTRKQKTTDLFPLR